MRKSPSSGDRLFWLKHRFPSPRDVLLAFIVCALPVHAWTWVLFFYKVPSYLLQFSAGQTLGVFSYAQAFALLESTALCGLTVLVAFLLPRRLFLDRFVPQVVLFVLALTSWAIGIHQYGVDFAGTGAAAAETRPFLIAWTAGWLVVMLVVSAAMHYWPVIQRWLWVFADRLIVLSGFFLLVDAAAVLFVVVRNL